MSTKTTGFYLFCKPNISNMESATNKWQHFASFKDLNYLLAGLSREGSKIYDRLCPHYDEE